MLTGWPPKPEGREIPLPPEAQERCPFYFSGSRCMRRALHQPIGEHLVPAFGGGSKVRRTCRACGRGIPLGNSIECVGCLLFLLWMETHYRRNKRDGGPLRWPGLPADYEGPRRLLVQPAHLLAYQEAARSLRIDQPDQEPPG